METIESFSKFFDTVEVNDHKQIGFIDNFEQLRECLFLIPPEEQFVSTLSLIRIRTQINLIIENLFHNTANIKDHLDNLRS